MEKPVEKTANSKVVARRKGWDTTVAGSSSGLGGLFMLGGVLLATAFTAKVALKRRKQPGNESKEDAAGKAASKDAAAAAVCCKGRGHSEEARYAEDLLVDPPPTDKPTPLADSASSFIQPRPPALSEHQLVAASTHMDGAHRFDDAEEKCTSLSMALGGPAAKGEQHPEQDPILQDSHDSMLLVQMEPRNGNCSMVNSRTDIALTEPIDAKVGEAKILNVENETLQRRAFKDDENATVVECGQEGSGAVDRVESLLLQKQNLPEDMPTQAYHEDDEAKAECSDEGFDETSPDEAKGECKDYEKSNETTPDEAKVRCNDEEESDETSPDEAKLGCKDEEESDETSPDEAKVGCNDEEESDEISPAFPGSEMPLLPTPMEAKKKINTRVEDDESQIAEFLDEALQENRQKEETNHEVGDVDGTVLRDVEDKDLYETELPSQDSEKLQTFNSMEHQRFTSEDVHSNDDNLSPAFGVDVCGIEVLRTKDKVMHEEKPLVEHGAADETDKLQADHEEDELGQRDPVSQDLQDSDLLTSKKHDKNSPCIALESISCDPASEDVDKHIQDKPLQEERSAEKFTAAIMVDKVDEHVEVVAGDTGLLTPPSKCPSQLPSLEANGNLPCINEHEFGNLSQDELGVSLPQDELQQDRAIEEAEDKMCKADYNGSIKEQYQVGHISDSSPDDSTESSTEASSSYSSLDDYGLKSQSGIKRNQTEAHKEVSNQQKMVFHEDQQEMWLTATKIALVTKTTGILGLPMKHARLSFLQLAYALVGLTLILLIVCSQNRMSESYHLLYKFVYPPNPSS